MTARQKVHPLKGVVQPYSWGGTALIPDLLGLPETDQPQAEYWLGAHPNHPSRLGGEGLDQFLRRQGGEGLPFLLKVLDVRQMLSIQVHPKKESASTGFQAENQAGIPANAPHRNYKDDNHKPELMVALSEFYLLHGFKPEKELEELLRREPELTYLLPLFGSGDYAAVYAEVMGCSQQRVNEVLEPLVHRILPLYDKGSLDRDSEHFWAARAVRTFCKEGNLDRGIFSIYLFNLLHLRPGQGIYQPAGLPHAYLEGQNIEIMANSDNVLRAGLTDKHIDIGELMKHTRFEATHPEPLEGGEGEEKRFAPAVDEFELVQYHWEAGRGQEIVSASPEIWLVMQGKVELEEEGGRQSCGRGQAVFVEAGASVAVRAEEGSELFRALVPSSKKSRD